MLASMNAVIFCIIEIRKSMCMHMKGAWSNFVVTFLNLAWNSAKKYGVAVAFMKSNIELWRKDGGTAAFVDKRHNPRIFFIFLAELDIF